jgi:hypothetical protein
MLHSVICLDTEFHPFAFALLCLVQSRARVSVECTHSPARIKDEVSRVGKPNTLPDLRTLALSIDNRYWEREEDTH